MSHEAGREERFRALLAQEPPFAGTIGIEILSVSDDAVAAALTVGDHLRNRNGVMHGGALMGFADCLAGTASAFFLSDGRVTSTIESKTNFLRTIRVGERITGTCRLRHRGRTTTVIEIEIHGGDGKLAALVVQTQISLDR